MSTQQPEHLSKWIRDFVEHQAVDRCPRCLGEISIQVEDAATEILWHDDRRGVGIADWRSIAVLAVDALACEREGVHEDEDEDETEALTASGERPEALDSDGD
jgi:hypothetical protein